MDILGLKKEDINKLSIGEYMLAVDYCWNTYTNRRVDYWIAQASGDGKDAPKKGTFGIDWTPLNPVAQRLAREKEQRPIPKKFLEAIEKIG